MKKLVRVKRNYFYISFCCVVREVRSALGVIPSSALLRGYKKAFGVIPWLDHGIQKIIKNTNIISIFTGTRE
jgi:hypothetical protein